MKMINWENVRYSLEKTMSNTKLLYIISFLGVILLYSVTSASILFVSNIDIIDILILNSFIKNVILLGLNAFLKFSLLLVIEAFKISDNYTKEILNSSFLAQRNTNYTIFLNLILLVTNSKSKYDILFLILLQNLKYCILCRFNSNFIFRKLSYKIYCKNKIKSQNKLNEMLGENNFNFMSVFEGFKVCFYLAIFVLMYSPTLAVFAVSMLYIHLLCIRFSLNRSRISCINSNIYGFYFTYIIEKEFLITGKFFIIYLAGFFLGDRNVFYLVGANSLGDLAVDLIKINSYYSKMWVKKFYSEIKFTKKFSDEKFVNKDIYLQEINFMIEKLNSQFNKNSELK